MATLVTFHAHPDDEAIATGGTMLKARRAGHDVVLVVATRGEQGEPVEGVLAPGEQLWERRVAETQRAAEILGVDRLEFLGYEDSGMMGEPTNENPASFWRADLDEAAGRLAALLREVHADVLVVYDHHGGYGHPDHIQVHRVGMRAADLAGIARVYQVTMNRDRILAMLRARADELEGDLAERFEEFDESAFGEPESAITHAVDVSELIEEKRKAMQAHASQIAEDSFFLQMPADVFVASFGTEWYIERDAMRAPGEPFRDDLFAGID